ncbi:Nif3-like dinuclear metal center hexameric protein [Halobacterium yunchengense]|uniref:Nif3-like dinuclear metal center hexameric protein n=1 Tax=Halobacterium yunchengense TaxID=3108497 RepID=UPI00300B4639
MELSELAARYDQRLRVDDYEDAATNGVQVGPADREVERAAFAVDAAVATIEDAVEWGADVLVTHHGVVWGGIDSVTGREYDRVAPLVDGDCALYSAHLPLDGHPELGNAARLADVLGLENRAPFGEHAGEHLGTRGTAPGGYAADGLEDLLAEELDPEGGVQVLDFGPQELEDVAVLTGSGADWLREAEAAGVDALVTGEGKHKLYHEAREAGVSVFLAGHYATETEGVRALQAVAADWGLETTFVDHPTGL